MATITAAFIADVLKTGRLAEAKARVLAGTAQPKDRAQWSQLSTWSLVCEEVLDTDFDPDWYDDIITELTRRGFSFEQIDRMRALAWRTAGWLNYDLMLWEWTSLDERDMRLALDEQRKRGMVSADEHARLLAAIVDPHCLED